MKRKILGVLLCVAMVAGVLSGCGGDAEEPTADMKREASDDITDGGTLSDMKRGAGDDIADGGTLSVWCWDPEFSVYAMEEASEIYQADHPGFSVEITEVSWENVQAELTTAATGGALDTLPDILLMPDNAFQKNVISYPEAFADLTDTGIDFSQFSEAKKDFSVVDGRNYGVPFDNGTVIAAYRTDYLKEAGFTVDDFTDITWDEYIEKGKAVLEKTGKPLLSCQAGEPDIIMMMMQSCGASLFDGGGNPALVGNEALKKVMETYVSLQEAGVLAEVDGWEDYIQTMVNDTVAGTINGCWIMASIKEADDQSGKWAITNMPSLVGVENATNYSNNGGSSWAVTSNCKNIDLAADFLANTFAGSVEMYENIIEHGTIAAYLPAGDSDVYAQKDDFFSGDIVFTKIIDYASKCPGSNMGICYYEAGNAVAAAIQKVAEGADIDAEIEKAQKTAEFNMGQ